MSELEFSHLDQDGKAHMVNVGEKADSLRTAIAMGEISLSLATVEQIEKGLMKKGDVLTVAQIAGIMAAKKTSELIPLCHPIPLHHIEVELTLDRDIPGIKISAATVTIGKTGVEMEALMAVSIAALTVYDMVKAVEKSGKIQNIRLVEKHGGRSGDFYNQ